MRYFKIFFGSLLFVLPVLASAEQPHIISRDSWGANNTFLFTENRSVPSNTSSSTSVSSSSSVNERVKTCNNHHMLYPNEFRVKQTVETFEGKPLLWARRYSPKITQLVIHHTALEVNGDGRSGMEKMQALYEYHASKLGWGDIGYHFVIDDDGKIYEGKSGGDYVVGGHAYCNNIGTIGIAMMGNFEFEKPTNAQVVSLQELLTYLSDKYGIDANGTVTRRGERMPTIVGHEDLLSTECPGYFIRSTLSQIRKNVASGNTNKTLSYPVVQKRETKSLASERLSIRLKKSGKTSAIKEINIIGDTSFENRPGGIVTTTVKFTALRSYSGQERIATVKRSNSRIGIWMEFNGKEKRIREELILPSSLSVGNSIEMTIKFQLPRDSGTYTVDIGTETITLIAGGRRIRSQIVEPTKQTFSTSDRINTQTPGYRRAQAYKKLGITSSSVSRLKVDDVSSEINDDNIRIRLGFTGNTAKIINSKGRYVMVKKGNECELWEDGDIIDKGIVKVDAGIGNINTIENWYKNTNKFRGVIECRILDGELVLINELPLEDYMAGLAEEPDSEPYEKQKAFTIAARSYAAFYIKAEGYNRKFKGMPYDGDDSPTRFQMYGGYAFEKNNPSWVRAVKDTSREVLMKDDKIVKAAYFSSDDGRTRSPEENDWYNFPHKEVFQSKDDPWCKGMELRGHGVGMSGCGAKGQAKEGRSAEFILKYYYPGTTIGNWNNGD